MKNTKKILSLILLSVLLIGTLSVTSFAKENATVNEDYSRISYKGKEYVAINQKNLAAIEFYYTEKDVSPDITFNFSTSQAKLIDSYYFAAYYNDEDVIDVLEVEYSFANSMNMVSVTYLRSALYREFENLYTLKDYSVARVDLFSYNSYAAPVDIEYPLLTQGNYYEMTAFNLNNYEFMYVNLLNATEDFGVACGIIVWEESNEKYYYLDYKNNGIDPAQGVETIYTGNFFVIELTNDSVVNMLDDAIDSDDFYIDEDFELDLEGNPLIATIAIVLSAIVFGLAPLVCAIICFVKSRKAEAPYSALLLAIAITCAAVAFLVALILLFLLL